jgi:hypothetical protein
MAGMAFEIVFVLEVAGMTASSARSTPVRIKSIQGSTVQRYSLIA